MQVTIHKNIVDTVHVSAVPPVNIVLNTWGCDALLVVVF